MRRRQSLLIAAFWALALGYVKESGFAEPDNASIIDPCGQGPAISFLKAPNTMRDQLDQTEIVLGALKVPEGKSAKNRMHIGVRGQ
jgi:hypothetical protein